MLRVRDFAAPLAAALMMLTADVVSAAATTSADSASAQPTLPNNAPKSAPPVVNSLVGAPAQTPSVRRRHAAHVRRRLRVAHRARGPVDVERPALAGVELLAPLPPPPEPPHIIVPMPEYPLDSIATALTMPPPPVVCRRTPRIRDLPDPRLYREVTLECLPDNP